jgi:hypothetical protein
MEERLLLFYYVASLAAKGHAIPISVPFIKALSCFGEERREGWDLFYSRSHFLGNLQ